jgi:hypothetical protein
VSRENRDELNPYSRTLGTDNGRITLGGGGESPSRKMAQYRDGFSCKHSALLFPRQFPAHPLFQHLIVHPTRGKEAAMALSHDRKYGIIAMCRGQRTARGMRMLTYELPTLRLQNWKDDFFHNGVKSTHQNRTRSSRQYLTSPEPKRNREAVNP